MKKPQDATMVNVRAAKKREAQIHSALVKRIKNLDLSLASWVLDLQTRIEKLEAKR